MIKWKIPKGIDEKYKELQTVLDILKAKKELSFFEGYFKDVLDDNKIHDYQPSYVYTSWVGIYYESNV